MINLFEPNVTNESLEILKEVFESKWLGRGEKVNEFEEKLAKFLRTDKENIGTIASCSDAIFGVLEILQLKETDEIIIPSISFPAIASAVIQTGAIPIIIDINDSNANLSLNELKKNLTKNTRAVFITSYGGIPNDIEKIREIVGDEVMILEDSACSLGTFEQGIASGIKSDFACWSFDAMKLLTCGEGGAFYAKDKNVVNTLKEHFYLGLPASEKSGLDKAKSNGNWWEYQLNRTGRRSIFTNINASIGLPQLSKLDDVLTRKDEIRKQYIKGLDKNKIIIMPQENSKTDYSNYFFTIEHKKRDELAKYLKSNGIYTSLRYQPLHQINIFKKYSKNCRNAEKFFEKSLNIPIHQNLTNDEVDYIIDKINGFN